MFEYLEPDASGASNLPPANSSKPQPRQERVRHMLYGSLAGIDRTIKILHALGYADPNDWSEPMPAPLSGAEPRSSSGVETRSSSGVETRSSSGVETWMVILTKILLIE
ncbi:hypothetical protein IQ273_23285 [Nodosilinea sp. LEGE 07298]|uniref:hypothetical protein n=1 Tax=Nodosilinea sp. LEGE 07298 TaxID=2777970 RepID=UPI0018805C83|nr:hypothetical protein [Nodosilinea sp. LEGE 07298]MBE9112326.1 hypothetical protein [Nodosilinea sp. LEGE 07298]